MVTQRKRSKLSREAKKARAKVESLAPSEQRDFRRANRAAFQEMEDFDLRSENRQLLLEIANLHDAGWKRFSRRWLPRQSEGSVMKLRDELRAIWDGTLSAGDGSQILYRWLAVETWHHFEMSTPETKYLVLPWSPDLRTGRLLPDAWNLPARLVTATLEYFPLMRKCSNPDCAVPHFITKRKSQRFCERGECTRYAQNQYALKWWRE